MPEGPNRLFGVPCDEKIAFTARLECNRCGEGSAEVECVGMPTRHFAILEGVLFRFFRWRRSPFCRCRTRGVWLEDGPVVYGQAQKGPDFS